MIKNWFLAFFFFSTLGHAIDVNQVHFYAVHQQKEISLKEFLSQVAGAGNFVVGEEHYTEKVQQMEAFLFEELSKRDLKKSWTLAWEFLEFENQEKIQKANVELNNGSISEDAFLARFFNVEAYPNTNYYAPIFSVVKKISAQVIGVNATRVLKRRLIQGGLSALDPAVVPPQFSLGSSVYRERFVKEMEGHVPADKIDAYYLAQCYTDDVMAWKLEEYSFNENRFFIMGSFHEDYFSGAAARIKRRSSLPVTTFKLFDGTRLSKDAINEILNPVGEFGPIADFVVYVLP